MPEIPDDLIAPSAAARIVGVTLKTMYAWMRKGKLRQWRIVGRKRVSEAEVRALIEPVAPNVVVVEIEGRARKGKARVDKRLEGWL